MIKYIVLGFVFASGIGPVNIETAKRGLTGKIKSPLFFYLGNVIVDAFYILIIALGFSFFVENIIIKISLGIFGILYLLYLGINDIRDFTQKNIFTAANLPQKRKLHPMIEGILVNIANPTAIASWLAFYGVVSEEFNKSIFNFLGVVGGAILLGLLIVVITHFSKRIIGEKAMRYVSIVSGIILIGFAIFFAYNLMLL